MRALGFVAALVLAAASPAWAQNGPPPNDDRPPQNYSEPRFDPRSGPGPGRPPMSEAPFTPRRDFGPPPGYGPRQESRPPQDAQRDPPRDNARRAPPPPPKAHANKRPPPRDDVRRAPPRDHRQETQHARRDDRRRDPRLDRRPPPPRYSTRDSRDYREARRDPRDAYRDDPRRDPRYERRGPPPRDSRDYRDDRGPPRDYHDRRDEPRHVARNAPRVSSEHRRALLREYERNARRQLEIERELGGAPLRPLPYRDRYSDAGPYRR